MQLIYNSDCLEHHGIKGQKWGRRRYQNADGSLTSAGRTRYGLSEKQAAKKIEKFNKKIDAKWLKAYNKAASQQNKALKKINKKYSSDEKDLSHLNDPRVQAYLKEAGDSWTSKYKKQLIRQIGKDPINKGEAWVKNMPYFNDYKLIAEGKAG